MASQQLTSKARQGRSRAVARRTRSIRLKRRRAEREAFVALRKAIENERGELARAESVLGCLHSSLLFRRDPTDKDAPFFAGAADVAHRLVRESVHRLESLYIGMMLNRIPEGGKQKQSNGKRSVRQGQPL